MRRYIIAAGVILLVVGATLATAQERRERPGPGKHMKWSPPDHGGGHGRGEWRGHGYGRSRGHEEGGWREERHGRRGPRWVPPRRVHYHGGFWRWVFGHGCWCGRQGRPNGGHGHR